MSRKRKQRCTLPGCTNDAYYKEAKVCQCCYAFLYYWKQRSVTDKMKHVQRVGRWNERVAALIPQKVVRITKSRRRKAG